MKKSYIYPKTEVLNLSGTLIMLGASGDLHSDTSTQEGPQSGNRVKLF